MKQLSRNTSKHPQNDFFIITSNLILFLFTTLFLLIVPKYYKNRIDDITLNENRFITTEWRLLQELREQTDKELLEKEQEIAELNKRYLKLIEGDAPSEELKKINTRLKQAQKEREQILSRQKTEEESNIDKQKIWVKGLAPSNMDPAIISFYKTRIDILENQLEKANDMKTTNSENNYSNFIDEQKQLKTELLSLKEEINIRLNNINTSTPGIDEINTRSIIRAILSSNAIKAQHPDLLDSFDIYINNFGYRERQVGQKEAYSIILEQIEKLK